MQPPPVAGGMSRVSPNAEIVVLLRWGIGAPLLPIELGEPLKTVDFRGSCQEIVQSQYG